MKSQTGNTLDRKVNLRRQTTQPEKHTRQPTGPENTQNQEVDQKAQREVEPGAQREVEPEAQRAVKPEARTQSS